MGNAAIRFTSIESSFHLCDIYRDCPRDVAYPADARSVGASHPSRLLVLSFTSGAAGKQTYEARPCKTSATVGVVLFRLVGCCETGLSARGLNKTVMLVLVLVLKDSLRTKMQSLSWSLSLTMQSLSLSLLLKSLSLSWSLNKSPWSCPCFQFYLKVNLLKRHVHGAS